VRNNLSSLRLYEIGDAYLAALQSFESAGDDLPLDAIADTLEGLAGTFHEKVIAVAAYVRNLELEATAIEHALLSMRGRKERIENHTIRLREYLIREMNRTEIRRVDSPELCIRIQKNPAKVQIDDDTILPDKFKEFITETRILKTAIRDELKAGYVVPGARLEQDQRVVIG